MSLSWALVLATGFSSLGDGEPRSSVVTSAVVVEPNSMDCGPISLLTLLQFEGRFIDRSRLEGALPRRTAEGYSLDDLRKAAASLGLGLRGIRVGRDVSALDRPMIVYSLRGDEVTSLSYDRSAPPESSCR